MSIMGASVSGMNADTTWLSAISQNVANANTTGYKNAQTSFEALVDQASTTSYDAVGVSTNTMQLNSMQGTVVGNQSAVTDLAVQGNGFFVVSNAAGDIFLTRDGSFVPDAQGNLVNSDGYYLMGYNIQNGPATMSANSYAGMSVVNVDKAGEEATASSTGVFAANLPADAATGQAETTSLVAYDNLGGTQNIGISMTKAATPADTWNLTATDSAGNQTTATLTFDPNTGDLAGLTPGAGVTANGDTLSIPIPGGKTLALDLSGMTQLAGNYNVATANVNGNAPSSVTGVSIASNGTLSFNFSNGQNVNGYQIALANVPSPDNLVSVNGNAYQTSFTSGQPTIGTAGAEGFGTIASSSLESSTVDLATELTQMIQAQSSYEANSKVFQTGADLLDVLNNLKP
jgi:flagellar hook protein FlgE